MNRRKKYEESKKGKKIRLFNYEAKWNFLLNVKAQIKCEDCSIDNPVILTFHHRNPEEKEIELSMRNAQRSWESIIKEIEKCDILCFNCHILRQEKIFKLKKPIRKIEEFLLEAEKQISLRF